MAVPLARNAFAEKRPDLFGVFSKRSKNVLFSFFLYKTTKRYSFRKIFAVLSIILRLQKKGTEFLGNDHHHYSHHHNHPHQRHHHHPHHHRHHQTHHHSYRDPQYHHYHHFNVFIIIIIIIVITAVWNSDILKKGWSKCQIRCRHFCCLQSTKAFPREKGEKFSSAEIYFIVDTIYLLH